MYKVTACIDRLRNLHYAVLFYLGFNVLVQVIFLIVALLNNVKVDKSFISGYQNRKKKTYKINKNE